MTSPMLFATILPSSSSLTLQLYTLIPFNPFIFCVCINMCQLGLKSKTLCPKALARFNESVPLVALLPVASNKYLELKLSLTIKISFSF